ncbi:hydrolase, alpha/beta domain protein [Slackia exigua ATCC 700122]|uniref:Hydrolase, alpha/beta domain protein n=2 Tax=Slackia TaxID=84108 RepID=D0WGU9_SLAES|nr:hydrolase, alpha/beta domain protein [Slackia exigua ATCC 700122]STN99306.1 acetoin dehydrogenase E2 subunit dihydrolipoyllysine-residue acetyltransferase [Slackia exigua]
METAAAYRNPYEGGNPSDVGGTLRRAGFKQANAPLTHMSMNYVEGPDNGLPLVLIPAQMGIWQTYEKVLVPLARSFHVFAIEIRGHGRSSWTSGDYTWSSMGGDVAEFVERVVGEPAIISGNSSGGIIGLWCASHAARWVRALVLEDAPVFCVEMPRFKERDRFTYEGLRHLVNAIGDIGDRDLADYFRGQVMPVSETRTKEMPEWFVSFISRKLKQTAARQPGSPVALDQWYLPAILKRQFQSLKTFDPDFARAFVDGRVYEDFSHEAALRQVGVPLLVMHANWHRYERYGLVGAMDDDDARRIAELVPHADYVRIPANHVIHAFKPRAFVRALEDFADAHGLR